MEKVKPSIEQNNFFKIQLILFGNHKRALLKFSAEERWDFSSWISLQRPTPKSLMKRYGSENRGSQEKTVENYNKLGKFSVSSLPRI